MKKKKIMLQRCLDNEAIYGASNRNPFLTAVHIYFCGTGKRTDWIFQVIKALCFQMCLKEEVLIFRPCSLQYFLKNDRINTKGYVLLHNFPEFLATITVDAFEKIDQDRRIYQDHAPSRNIL